VWGKVLTENQPRTENRELRTAPVALLFIVLSIAMTWPLARNVRSAVSDPGDPFLNAWILDWDHYATFHAPLSLFDANAFHPSKYALAFSENLYGIAILLIPLRLAGVAPLTAYNLAILAGFAFSGFGAWLLGRKLTGSSAAGVAAGVFFTFVPFRFTQLSHIQHVWGGWLPVLLAALLHYAEAPTRKRAALFGAAFLMNGLTNIHWLLFGSLAIVGTVAMLMVAESATWSRVLSLLRVGHPRRLDSSTADQQPIANAAASHSFLRRWLPLFVATAVSFLVLLPFLWPYYQASRVYGMVRHWQEVRDYSARAADWLVSNPNVHIYQMMSDPGVDPERWLFPGFLSLILAATGAVVGLRRTENSSSDMGVQRGVGSQSPAHPSDTHLAGGGPGTENRELRTRFHTLIALFWLLLGFLGSLGMRTAFHKFLFAHVLGFQAVRVPARWAMLVYVALAMLVAIATAAKARRRQWIAALIAVAFLVELRAAPIRWYLTVPEAPPVYQWLKTADVRGGVLELPFNEKHGEYGYLFRAMTHHKPLLNGTSGFAPPSYLRLDALLHESPISDAAIEQLKRMDCGLIVVHAGAITAATREWLAREVAAGRLRFVREFDGGLLGDWLFSLREGAPAVATTELAPFLRSEPTYTNAAFGLLDTPAAGSKMGPHPFFSGWAFSPYGIRKVELLLENGALRYPTSLHPDPQLSALFHWYPVPMPRFVAAFDQRPAGVSRQTDVQVEITDGRGEKTRLEDQWFEWPTGDR
jgi:hypothetical protein